MKYTLQNTTGLTAEQITDLVNRGATFRIFTYQVALVAVTFSRPSPAILIRNNADLEAARKKYNLKTWLFGLWAFPYGPLNVYKRIKQNNSGGIDVTQDVLINLAHHDKEQQTVEIKIIHTLFDHLPGDELKELKRAIENYCMKTIAIKSAYAAQYINVEEHVMPPYCIGCDTTMEPAKLTEALTSLIYSRFNKFVQFEIFTKNQDEELFSRIKSQGQKIVEKQL